MDEQIVTSSDNCSSSWMSDRLSVCPKHKVLKIILPRSFHLQPNDANGWENDEIPDSHRMFSRKPKLVSPGFVLLKAQGLLLALRHVR